MVYQVSFHVNGAEGTGWAEVFAGSTPDAFALVDGRNHDGLAVMLVFHHLDGSSGAVACAVATADAIGENHAVVFHPYGVTYMDGGLLFLGDGSDGSGRTHLAATGALRTAIAALKRKGGLHEVT